MEGFWHSALSIQHSAFSIQHSVLDADCLLTADPGTIVKLQVQDAAGTKREVKFVLRGLV
jgi:hypothetical protein